jgi:hypothetical protein
MKIDIVIKRMNIYYQFLRSERSNIINKKINEKERKNEVEK